MRNFSTSSRRLQNHYQVLGLSVNASAQEIKKQFYVLSKKYHPDANQDVDPSKYQQITEAYSVLSNEQKRRDFDTTLGKAVRQPQGYTGERRSWQGTKRAASGFAYHERWATRPSHQARKDPNLDPLRPRHRDHSANDVPHFNSARHFDSQRRQDAFRDRHKRSRQQKSTHTPPKHSSGLPWALGGAAGTLLLGYLFIR